MALVNHASPARPASASPKKLQVFQDPPQHFGTSPAGTARQKAKKLQKFTFDHVGVDNPGDEVLREMFEFFDVDRSGSLDKAEFRKLYAESFENYGAPLTQKDLDRQFAKLDRDNSGRLSYDEFAILMLSRLKM